MRALVRHELGCRLTPEFFSGISVEAQDFEFVKRIGVLDSENPFRLVFWLGTRGIDATGVDRCQQKHFVAPNNWRCIPLPIDRDFPADVLVFTPLDRRFRSATDAVGFRTSPLMPVRPLSVDASSLQASRPRPRIRGSGRTTCRRFACSGEAGVFLSKDRRSAPLLRLKGLHAPIDIDLGVCWGRNP